MRVALLTALAAGLAGAAADSGQQAAGILTARCGECHSAKLRTSGFSVVSLDAVIAGGNKHGRAVIGGHPEKSALVRMLRGEMEPRMPMGSSMAAAEIEAIEAWIRGLPAAEPPAKQAYRWPFEKPAKPALPTVKDTGWIRQPIDAFILQKLEAKNLRPATPAPRNVLARRVYFDLIGLPPTSEELRAFVDDPAPDAYERMIDRLLADPRYGEKWARHWLDLVRYGETSGLEGDGMIGNAWRYRDWVVEAFNKDMPYDRFVIAQLAGADEHSKTRNNYPPNIQGHVPLGFLRIAPWDRSNLVADEVRQNYLSEVTSVTSSVFLGLTMGCARCHDHKYDPIPQRDYYRLQAFFNAIQVENVEVPYKDADFSEKAAAKVKELQARLKDGPEKTERDAYEKELLAKLVRVRKEEAPAKKLTVTDLRLEFRRKKQVIFTLAEKLRHADLLEDANRTQDAEEKQALEEFEGTLTKRLEAGYSQTGYDALARFDTLTAEDVRSELGRRESKVFTETERERHRELSEKLDVIRRRLGRWQPTALTVKNVPGPPNGPGLPPTRILIRGDYRQTGEAVEAGFPSAISGNSEPATIESDRYRQYPTRGWRLTLAKWIASPDNPLTARVMANRVWQYHFGAGIVATPSDFGVNGERPTHPELLDWLAHHFIEDGWSIKAMHRLVLTSATYRQASDNPLVKNTSADAENRLLWKFPRRRLSAEELRDSILHLSGRLNLERGGPSVFPPLPDDLADFARYGRTGGLMWEPNEKEEDARRRSLYTFQRRSMPLPMMAAFDAPVFSESCERRVATTTPLQALSMMNGRLVHDEAAQLAARVQNETGGDRKTQVRRVFSVVLQRAPSDDEEQRLLKLDGGLEAVCRVLLNTNEFLYLD